jgi:hypothetical protein
MTLNDAPLAYQDCVASASGFLADGHFTVRLRDGGDSAEVVVTDLFPGLQATVSNPVGGQVAPGATFDVTIPPALQFETPVPFGARFTYTDADDPTYLGDATNPTAGDGVIHVLAPQHPGHHTLWISMATPTHGRKERSFPVRASRLAARSARPTSDLSRSTSSRRRPRPRTDSRGRGPDGHCAVTVVSQTR